MEILDYQIYEGGKNMNEIIVDDKKVEDMIYEIRVIWQNFINVRMEQKK